MGLALHYVALSSGVPFDTDSDGLPDFYENENGDGLENDTYHWQHADTDSNGTNDGNEDQDGDGVTNANEYALGTDPTEAHEDYDHDGLFNDQEVEYGRNPLVSDNFMNFINVPTGTLSGAQELQIQFASGYLPHSLSLRDEAGHYIDGVTIENGNTPSV